MLRAGLNPWRRIVGFVLPPLVLLATLASPASAYPRPGITERVSVASDGTEADGHSYEPAVSADGRYIAFPSESSNLVSGDTNGSTDVFVHDQATGITERLSIGIDGTEANGSSYEPATSADGRHVAFRSTASNLVPGDTNGASDVFVHDRSTGTTERVSLDSDGKQANSLSFSPAISADGRYVAFESTASTLVPGDSNAAMDVFVHDRSTGTTERASVASDGTGGNSNSYSPALSADGRYVAFRSTADNLVPGDTNGVLSGIHGFYYDIFVHDRSTGTTDRVSVDSDGTEADATSFDPAISADGRYVAFPSVASNLVPADTNTAYDVFVHDRTTRTTERVSVASNGTEADARSTLATISADGRHVAFYSAASNLVPADTGGITDVFVHDRATRVTERISTGADATEADSASYDPIISADGRHVVFRSTASNLVSGDGNGVYDVFVRERGGPLDVVGTPAFHEVAEGVAVTGRATFSGATLTEAIDPDDDGVAPDGTVTGSELTGAALIYRPEQEDLLLRLDLASQPPVAGGLPAVLYGAELSVGETRYEIRSLRAGATTTAPRSPYAALYRCDPGCTEHVPLTGSLGSTGAEVLVSVPLTAIGASEGTDVRDVRAFATMGEVTPGPLLSLDEIDLPSSAIPNSRVELGIADASTPEGQVHFTLNAELLAGEFSGTISTVGRSPESHRVWVRVCLGDACGSAMRNELAFEP